MKSSTAIIEEGVAKSTGVAKISKTSIKKYTEAEQKLVFS